MDGNNSENSSLTWTMETPTGEITDNTNLTQGDEPHTEDGHHNSETDSGESESQEVTTQPDEEKSATSDDRKKSDTIFYKKVLVDEIEEKFRDLSQGNTTRDAVKAWLDKRNLHDIADQSKRVKDTYRSFMRGYKPTAETRTSETDTAQPDIKQLVDEAINERITKEQSEKDTALARDYATQFKFQDKEYEKLVVNAKALKSVNPSMTFEDALKSAHLVVRPSRTSLSLPRGVGTVPQAAQTEQRVDLTEGFTIKIPT